MPLPTDTTAYPVFASKQAMLRELRKQCEPHLPNFYDLLRRICNTDTSTFGDPTYDLNE